MPHTIVPATVAAVETTCCIIGGGPAGIMLGFLLARAGVHVTVLEKHKDFFRDFRGDTIHPSTLQLLHELGLLDEFLVLPHATVARMSAIVGGKTFAMADFSHLPTAAKFIALMPQWDFLNFLAKQGSRLATFDLRMNWEATGLQTSGGRVTGVDVKTPEGPQTITANLVVGCDGRHAISRESAHLPVVEEGVPVDVLWLHISRKPGDPENALGYVNFGRALILINRNDYFQCGYIIAKDQFPKIQEAGLPSFQQGLVRIAPFLAGREQEIDSWEKVKLLTVQINHLSRWWQPGLLCIGDSAHAMSPVGGIGINIALQDAVATASLLSEALQTGNLTDHHLKAVQDHRSPAVRRTQKFQAFAHRILNGILHNPGPVKPPLALKILTRIPGFQYLLGRFIGLGLQPEHIRR